MDFTLSDEQKLLQESVERFVDNDYPFQTRRDLAASDLGFGRDNWSTFAELGWLAAPLPEDHGGLGGSTLDVAVLMEGLGRGLAVEPYVPTVVLGGGLVAIAGTDAQKAEVLPAIAEGRLHMGLAHSEARSRFDLADIAATARAEGDDFVLDGDKSVVFNAQGADTLVVAARTSGAPRESQGVTLFLLGRDAPGVGLRSYPTVDGLRAAEVHLEGVRVGSGAVVGAVDGGLEPLEHVIDLGIVAVCAEAVGIMDALLKTTQEYLKTRVQFGVPLGSFQVLQHRVVDMFTAYELSKALTYRAAAAVDGDAGGRARAASAAKVQIGRAGRFVGQQSIQLHGGMGMTDELSVGHYFKRLSMIDVQFGNADHHLSRFAELG